MVPILDTPDAVTPDWLAAVLGQPVDELSWQPIGTGQVGDSARFTYVSDGIPGSVVGKFPAADPASRGTATLMGLYAREVAFYTQARPLLDVRAPRVHHAAAAPDGQSFVLIFEDLGPARQGDQLQGAVLADAEAAVREAAALHAPSRDAAWLTADWLRAPPGLREQLGQMYGHAQSVFKDRYADALPAEHMELCAQLAPLVPAWFANDPVPECLIHGDYRLDNMLFDICGGTEPIAVLDWQTAAAGRGMTDIGYLLGCGLGELGLRHQDHLLALYFDAVAERGAALPREAAMHDYRTGILHGVSTAVFSAAFVERTERGDANFLSMARGACALALANDSLAALKEEMA